MPGIANMIVVPVIVVLAGCGGGSGEGSTNADASAVNADNSTPATLLDDDLRALIRQHGLTGDPSAGRALPSIEEPLPQLGKKLFFSKALAGEFDSACVSCHHPSLGGADALSLSVGVGAVAPDLLGPGRGGVTGVPNVARNAPTTFNIGLRDSGLFLDSRVASLGAEPGLNGSASGISTPDSGFNVIDVNAGPNLPAAQARFPVASVEEMRGALEIGQPDDVLRTHLAARIGNYGAGQAEIGVANWLAEFQTAFASAQTADQLITFDNIAVALSEYERSQVFVDTAWRSYVQGDNGAINDEAKRGAILFLSPPQRNGAGCVQCHSGDLFSDERHHAIGAPQFGPGKGNAGNNDFGRENITGDAVDGFRFRTPSLLNVAVTGPYMHTGAYESLQEVVRHYDNPRGSVRDFFADGGWCQLEQFAGVGSCTTLYPNAEDNSNAALNKVQAEQRASDPAALPNINLNNSERDQIVAFLETLTDPCVRNRDCLMPWIPALNESVDAHQLNAVDRNGNAL